MGRGIRPIESFGEDGQRAALELAEAMGLMSDKSRAKYSAYYDTEGELITPEGRQPVFGTLKVNLGDGEIGVLTDASDAHYYTSEFDVGD